MFSTTMPEWANFSIMGRPIFAHLFACKARLAAYYNCIKMIFKMNRGG
jgi:hypothetical protein